MFDGEVLVGEGFGAVDAGAACSVAVDDVAALDHEVFDLFGCYLSCTVLALSLTSP